MQGNDMGGFFVGIQQGGGICDGHPGGGHGGGNGGGQKGNPSGN